MTEQTPHDPWRPIQPGDTQSYPTVLTEPGWREQPPSPPEPPTGQASPSGPRRWVRGTAAAGVLALVALGSGTAGAVIANHVDQPSSSASGTLQSSLSDSGSTNTAPPTEPLAKVAAAVMPSVVSITVTTPNGQDEGSGVVLSSDGVILTNNHVVDGAQGGGSITVKFVNGRSASANIVGTDPSTDLAVLRAEGISDAKPATLGTSDSLHVGDTVLAIGSPLGLEGSVSAGIVSALHRIIDEGQSGASIPDAIQTDAAINPGNSGGPLLDVTGKVVGLNTAIASLGSDGLGGQSGNIGVGFAIPIDTAKQVVSDILAGRKPTHALLGVQVTDAQGGGALIASVAPNSAAAAAGLRAGDVITQVGNVQVTDGDTLASAVRAQRPGDKVVVDFTRDGRSMSAEVTLGSSGS